MNASSEKNSITFDVTHEWTICTRRNNYGNNNKTHTNNTTHDRKKKKQQQNGHTYYDKMNIADKSYDVKKTLLRHAISNILLANKQANALPIRMCGDIIQ